MKKFKQGKIIFLTFGVVKVRGINTPKVNNISFFRLKICIKLLPSI